MLICTTIYVGNDILLKNVKYLCPHQKYTEQLLSIKWLGIVTKITEIIEIIWKKLKDQETKKL